MILFPPAKVNIGLNVLGKRADGYHDIESVMVSIPLFDVLEVLPADEMQFITSGNKIVGELNDNLCVKAYEAMKNRFNLPPVYIHLIKNIPMGAGLGGGSSDASSVILVLNELFDLKCSISELEDIAAEIGSDCPFFIQDNAQLAEGRGEILTPIQLEMSSLWIKLIHPEIHVSTAEAYKNVRIDSNSDLRRSISSPIDTWKDCIGNSFENSVFESNPILMKIKNDLYQEGAIYASMSGSGSAMYGLYDSKPAKSKGYEKQWVLKLTV